MKSIVGHLPAVAVDNAETSRSESRIPVDPRAVAIRSPMRDRTRHVIATALVDAARKLTGHDAGDAAHSLGATLTQDTVVDGCVGVCHLFPSHRTGFLSRRRGVTCSHDRVWRNCADCLCDRGR